MRACALTWLALTATFAALPAQASAGAITTVAGTGTAGFSGDGGAATAAQLNTPFEAEALPDGSFLIADSFNQRVRRVSAAGTIATAAGTGSFGGSGDGGPATAAQLATPDNVLALPDGGFLISEADGNRVRRVSATGIISTFAGTGTAGFSGDGGPAVAAQISNPAGLSLEPDGAVLLADGGNGRVRRIAQNGTGTWIITTVAGGGGASGDGGLATSAALGQPADVSAAPDGGFLIADLTRARIRRVSAAGIITTAAGTGSAGYSGDGGPATAAQISQPQGVVATPDGGFLIADQGNSTVRLVQSDGTIRTVAGTGTAGYSGDGGPAASAQLNGPTDISILPSGPMLVSDTGNQRIRQVSGDFHDTTPPTSSATNINGSGCATTPGLVVGLAKPSGAVAGLLHTRVDGGADNPLTSSGGSVTIPLAEGRHQVEFWAEDSDGNIEAAHHQLAVLVDSDAPAVTILSNSPNTTFDQGATATATVRATDPDGLVVDPSTASLRLPTDVVGLHEVVATARDTCDNSATAHLDYTVKARPAVSPASPLTCSGRAIVLYDVHIEGGRVVVAGLALPRYAGRSARIAPSGPASYAASAMINDDGTFSARLPLPRGPAARLTRYRAIVDGQVSRALKVTRAFVVRREHESVGGLVVDVQVRGGHRGQTITLVRQLSCSTGRVYARPRLGPHGRLTIQLARPGNGDSLAFYRAVAHLGSNITFTLPIVVRAAPHT